MNSAYNLNLDIKSNYSAPSVYRPPPRFIAKILVCNLISRHKNIVLEEKV
jgi:hypothetical protein